ncbi:gliding motility-associated C-terminal domain-containing protein [Mucilaginibacter celer]|nr:gliding motility-associated C-terminal domain-containing protein [Mucilaginibacter celer]
MIAFVFTKAKAQSVVCTGSLGDPVLKYTFGAGPNYGAPLGTDFTDFIYTQACPADGQYTIVNSGNINPRNGGGNCHPGGWQPLPHDHTGDPNGYMMIVNASHDPSTFFTYKIPNGVLCPDTKYEFSAFILNLIVKELAGPGFSRPDIVFSITRADGTKVTYDTGAIPESANPDDWRKYSMPFRTPRGNTAITLEMVNKSPGGTGNDLALDDIEFRACGPAIPVGFGAVGNTQPQPACSGDPKTYHLVANPGAGYDDPKYQWQNSFDKGTTWTDIQDPKATSPNYDLTLDGTKPPGTYQYRLAVAEGRNINSPGCRTYSGVLTINMDSYPVVPHIDPVYTCVGEPIILRASGGASYEWVGPGVNAVNKNKPDLEIKNASLTDAGDYKVYVQSAGGCVKESNIITVSIETKPVITITGPSQICSGTTAVLQAYAPNAKTYVWSPAEGVSDPATGTLTVSPKQTTVYTVTAITANRCEDSKTITLEVLPSPQAIAGPDKTVFEGKSVVLEAQAPNAGIYLWTPATGLDDPSKLNPVASPVDDVTYTLKAMSDNGCEPAFASVFVKVFKKVNIPTAFTPNGDGVNDTWNIKALETYPKSELKVFNRNGQTVFTTTGYSKPWNGGYNGYRLPTGTYYYILDLKDGEPIRSGWVFIAY